VALLTFLLGTIVAAFGLSPMEAGLLASMTFAGQLVGNGSVKNLGQPACAWRADRRG